MALRAVLASFNCKRNICRSHPRVPEEAGPPSRPPEEIHLGCSFLTPAMDFVLPVSLDCFILWTSFLIHPRLFLVLPFWDCWLDFEDLFCLKLQSLFGLLAPDFVLPCCVNLVTLPAISSLCLKASSLQFWAIPGWLPISYIPRYISIITGINRQHSYGSLLFLCPWQTTVSRVEGESLQVLMTSTGWGGHVCLGQGSCGTFEVDVTVRMSLWMSAKFLCMEDLGVGMVSLLILESQLKTYGWAQIKPQGE